MSSTVEVIKATPIDVPIPGLQRLLPLILLPDGGYEVEQKAIAAVAGYKSDKPIRYLLTKDQGFQSRHKSAITEAQKLAGHEVEVAAQENLITSQFQAQQRQVKGKDNPSNTYPLVAAILCWQYWAEKGNAQCAALLGALAKEALEKRADEIAGIERTNEERNERLATSFKEIRQIVWARLKEETGYEVNGFQIDEPDTPVPGNHPKFKRIEYRRIEDVLWYFNPRTDTFSVAASTPNRKDYDLWEAFCGFYETFGTLESNMRVLKGLRAAASELAPHLIR